MANNERISTHCFRRPVVFKWWPQALGNALRLSIPASSLRHGVHICSLLSPIDVLYLPHVTRIFAFLPLLARLFFEGMLANSPQAVVLE